MSQPLKSRAHFVDPRAELERAIEFAPNAAERRLLIRRVRAMPG